MQGGLSGIPARAAEVLREEGLRSLYFKILGETAYRRLELWELRLGESIPTDCCTLDVECRLLEPGDVDAYLELKPERSRAETLDRLERGWLCCAVWHQRRIVHSGWVGFGRCRVEYLDLEIEAAEGVAYLFEAFTAPGLRGSRLASARLAFWDAVLPARGIHKAVGAQWPENAAITKSSTLSGMRPIGRIGRWKVGGLRRDFCWYRTSGDRPIELARG